MFNLDEPKPKKARGRPKRRSKPLTLRHAYEKERRQKNMSDRRERIHVSFNRIIELLGKTLKDLYSDIFTILGKKSKD